MSQLFRAAAVAKSIAAAGFESQDERRDRIVTVFATLTGMLMVGAIAVLMGMI